MAEVRISRATLLGNSFGCQIIASPPVTPRLQGPTTGPAGAHRYPAARALGHELVSRRSPRAPPLGAMARRDYRDAGVRRVLGTFREALRDRIELNLPHIPAPALVVQHWSFRGRRLAGGHRVGR
jgi:hypothetical protein